VLPARASNKEATMTAMGLAGLCDTTASAGGALLHPLAI
jgi:hypothetical protein